MGAVGGATGLDHVLPPGGALEGGARAVDGDMKPTYIRGEDLRVGDTVEMLGGPDTVIAFRAYTGEFLKPEIRRKHGLRAQDWTGARIAIFARCPGMTVLPGDTLRLIARTG
jgi:hypothetical protein